VSVIGGTAGAARFSVTGQSAQAVAAASAGWRAVMLDGARMRSKESLMATFAASLELSARFGANWDALNDVLSELAWEDESRVLLILEGADEVLADAPGERGTLVEVLAHAFDDADGEEDAELRVVMCSSDPERSALAAAARDAGVEVTLDR